MNRILKERRAKCNGFTLIELLTATAIMSVIILIVVGLASNIMGVWSRSVDQLASNAEGRILMSQLSEDLEAIQSRLAINELAWFQVSYPPPNETQDPEDRRFPALYIVTSTLSRPNFKDLNGNLSQDPGEEIRGNICLVAYSPLYQNPFKTDSKRGEMPPPVFGIYRAVIDAEATFNGLIVLAKKYEGSGSGTTLRQFWRGETGDQKVDDVEFRGYDGVARTIGSDINSWRIDRNNFLSANVVDLSIRVFYEDLDGNILAVPAVDADPTTYPEVIIAGGLFVDGSPVEGVVKYVEVAATLVSQEGVDLYNAPGSTFTIEQVLSEYGKVFTRRVYLWANAAQLL